MPFLSRVIRHLTVAPCNSKNTSKNSSKTKAGRDWLKSSGFCLARWKYRGCWRGYLLEFRTLVWSAVSAAGGGGGTHWPSAGWVWPAVMGRRWKESLICPLYSVGYKFSEGDLHQKRSPRIFFFSQSQELHSRIVSKSDCSLHIPTFLLVQFAQITKNFWTKLLLVVRGQFGELFLRPCDLGVFWSLHNSINSMLYKLLLCSFILC